MPVIVKDVAKTRGSASKKAQKHKKFYGPYYNSVTTKIKKLTPQDKKRDKKLKGYAYHIQVKLAKAKKRKKR